MGQVTDVFVIGGGPAGLAAALAARKRGLTVIVADGAAPPIDKACGEGLMPDTLEALSELGIVIQPKDGRSFRGVRFLDCTSIAEANFPGVRGIGLRRTILHQKMSEQAMARGITFLWNSPVTGVSPEGVRVGGNLISARWIVGADGASSRVRRWSGLDAASQLAHRFAFRRHYRVDPWTDCVEIYWGRAIQAYVTPLGDGETCVAVISRDPRVRLDAVWLEFPELAAHLQNAAPASSERGAVTSMHRVKKIYRGNVALIGDASGSVDAITGEGLCLSFRQATALADALAAGNLAEYQETHSRLARRPTMVARLMLLLDRHPQVRRRVQRALVADPEIFARLISAHAGKTSPAQLATTGALFGLRLLGANF